MGFVQEYKSDLLHLGDVRFLQKSLEAFRFQYENNDLYRQYVNALKINAQEVQSLEQIPFLPISFFKHHPIVSTTEIYENFFESSGTTGSHRSRLYFYDSDFYLQNAAAIFESFFGALSGYSFFFLLPNYLERKHSSLVAMANYFFQKSDQRFGGFYLHDFPALHQDLLKALHSKKQKVVLWGVTFALLDFAKSFEAEYENLTVFETGGMKGRGQEPLRSEVYEVLKSKWKCSHIHSEYGMTELFSQAYSIENEFFTTPSTMKVFIREMEDPLNVHSRYNERGGINIIDLANIDTCCFIETQDVGLLHEKGFQILGRFDNSEVRGCNLMWTN